MDRLIKHIVIHCSATPPDMDIGATEIDKWHRQRGWSEIGYHYVIRLNGTLEKGRDLKKIPSQAKGFNQHAIGICYVGGVDENLKAKDTRTKWQKQTMETLVKTLHEIFPEALILGHRDLPGVNKECPSFDVKKWLNEIGIL